VIIIIYIFIKENKSDISNLFIYYLLFYNYLYNYLYKIINYTYLTYI